MNIEEFIEQSNRATSVQSLSKLFEQAVQQLGFDRVVFTLINDHPTLQQAAKHGVAIRYPEPWMEQYNAQGYEAIDPVRDWISRHHHAFYWDDIGNRSAIQEQMFHEAQSAGLNNGIGVPLRGAGGAIAAVGAASSHSDKLADFAKDKLTLLSYQLYTSFWRMMEQEPVVYSNPLTEKEQEILKWLTTGMNKVEVGDRLHISSHTVSYHLRNILKKLDSSNTTAAVCKAINLNYLEKKSSLARAIKNTLHQGS